MKITVNLGDSGYRKSIFDSLTINAPAAFRHQLQISDKIIITFKYSLPLPNCTFSLHE